MLIKMILACSVGFIFGAEIGFISALVYALFFGDSYLGQDPIED